MKKLVSIFLLFFLVACGFSPVYKNIGTSKYDLIISEMTGDLTINNLIKNQINTYSDKKSEKKYNINFHTEFKKSIITKNSSGVATNYELYVKTTFSVSTPNASGEEFVFTEKFNVKNISDAIEQRNYENIIKVNFATSIKDKLISKIANIK
tara:strand:- start:441 stop:896 length:456 start_codon:yes stop_codon:yes gene_type:complete